MVAKVIMERVPTVLRLWSMLCSPGGTEDPVRVMPLSLSRVGVEKGGELFRAYVGLGVRALAVPKASDNGVVLGGA